MWIWWWALWSNECLWYKLERALNDFEDLWVERVWELRDFESVNFESIFRSEEEEDTLACIWLK